MTSFEIDLFKFFGAILVTGVCVGVLLIVGKQ